MGKLIKTTDEQSSNHALVTSRYAWQTGRRSSSSYLSRASFKDCLFQRSSKLEFFQDQSRLWSLPCFTQWFFSCWEEAYRSRASDNSYSWRSTCDINLWRRCSRKRTCSSYPDNLTHPDSRLKITSRLDRARSDSEHDSQSSGYQWKRIWFWLVWENAFRHSDRDDSYA